MEAGLSQLRRGGRLVLVGAGMEPPSFDPNRMLLNELEIHGSFIYDVDGFERRSSCSPRASFRSTCSSTRPMSPSTCSATRSAVSPTGASQAK